MFIIKKNILLIINKSLISLKLYVMIFNQITKFGQCINVLKKNAYS